MVPVPKTEYPLLGPGPFLVAPSTPERRIETTDVQRLAQGHSLHDVGVVPRPVVERVDAFSYAAGVGVDDQVQSQFCGCLVTELDHFPKLPGGVNVEQRERNWSRVEGLTGQM